MKLLLSSLLLLSALSFSAAAQDVKVLRNYSVFFFCSQENAIKDLLDIKHDYYVTPLFGFTVPFTKETSTKIKKQLDNSLKEFEQSIIEMRTKEGYYKLGRLSCYVSHMTNQQNLDYPKTPPKDLAAIMEYYRTNNFSRHVLQRERSALNNNRKRLTRMKWVPSYSERQTTEVKR